MGSWAWAIASGVQDPDAAMAVIFTLGALLLATSLVAILQLVAAALVWTFAVHVYDIGLTPVVTSSIVSLSGGAMLANVISVILLIIETVMLRR